jgi:hypothetical protein
VYAHNHPRGKGRTSKPGRDGAVGKAQTPARLDQLSLPQNEGNFAENVAGSQWSIWASNCVALGLNR